MVLLTPNKPRLASGELMPLPESDRELDGNLSRSSRFPSDLRSTIPTIEVERERHYFTLISVPDQLGVLDDSRRVRITQSYLPRSLGREILLATLDSESALFDKSSRVLQARVRKSDSFDGTVAYEYTVKLKNNSHSVAEKDEVTFEISRQEYKQMQVKASKGSVVKDRHSFDLCGLIGGAQSRIQLEVDLPLMRELGGRKEDLSTLGYAMIDLEVSDRALMEQLRQGQHDIPLLHQAVDISKDTSRRELREPLSWKTLARQGVTAEALQSVLELKQLSEAQIAA